LCYFIRVIWIFDRDGETLRYEIRRADKGDGYILMVTSPDGQKRVERVDQASALIERTVDEMRQLRDDGWKVG
jgi:hypothetical protein